MALKLNGKDDRLTHQDFLALARTIGVSAGNAKMATTDLTRRVAGRAKGLQLPAFAGGPKAGGTALDKVIASLSERSKALAADGG